VRPAYWSMTLNFYSRIAKIIAMPRGSTPGERRGGGQKGPPNKTVVAKAAHMVAVAGETAKAPSVAAYVRLFELAEDYDRETRAERPQHQTEVVECREWLARILPGLLACGKPRLTTTQVHDDKDCPVSTCQRSATARWRSRGHRTQGHGRRRRVRYPKHRSLRGARFDPCRISRAVLRASRMFYGRQAVIEDLPAAGRSRAAEGNGYIAM
jgi:hypothetical protein